MSTDLKKKYPCPHGKAQAYSCRYCHRAGKRPSGFCDAHENQRNMCLDCICKHNILRRVCTECNPALKRQQICEHGKIRKECEKCIHCIHGNRKKTCLACNTCEHDNKRSECKRCLYCCHGIQKYYCKECGGVHICPHMQRRSVCRECGGSSICQHNKIKHKCKECTGGTQICIHQKRKRYCVDCGGSSLCTHGRDKDRCSVCKEEKKSLSKELIESSAHLADLEDERLICPQCEEYKDIAEFIDKSSELQLPNMHCNNCIELICKSKGTMCTGGCFKFLFAQQGVTICQDCKDLQTVDESSAMGGAPGGVHGSSIAEPELASDLLQILNAAPDF